MTTTVEVWSTWIESPVHLFVKAGVGGPWSATCYRTLQECLDEKESKSMDSQESVDRDRQPNRDVIVSAGH
jgi:tripartite-type tricarboxylate transporter receptor subunit TctC